MRNTTILATVLAVAAALALAPSAAADHATVDVAVMPNTSVPGCEEDVDGCYNPGKVVIDPGSEVVWTNIDTSGHTVTSGIPAEGPDGVFDSGLFLKDATFSFMFEEAGDYPYFCIVHPWMVASVMVESGHGDDGHDDDHGDEMRMMTPSATMMSADNMYTVEIYADEEVSAGQEFMFSVKVMGSDGMMADAASYDIVAMQDGSEVLSGSGSGSSDFALMASSDNPVDISVMIDGSEAVDFQVVPEFGTIAVLVLAAAIISIVAITSRSGLITRI